MIFAFCAISLINIEAQQPFLYGASVYPEIMTKEEQIKMLDLFQKADYTVLRLGESAWGNIETEPGKYDFTWLHFFLDEMQKRNMKAILGTCSYVAPQWLAAHHPEVLHTFSNGETAHPLGRRSVCMNHPIYRQYLYNFIRAYAREFRDHPAVWGWQLDNERDAELPGQNKVCYNPACRTAWTNWLIKNYHTPDEMNQRLGLRSWGMQFLKIEDVPQPRPSLDPPNQPILDLAYERFHKDMILDFFAEQVKILRSEGIKQPILTDWCQKNITPIDDPRIKGILDISGLNLYQPSEDADWFWEEATFVQDLHRSENGNNKFFETETRIGVTGGQQMWGGVHTPQQLKMWMTEAAAFGAIGVMHWTGNRWTGGHWPHWGGVLDWTGTPEPDYQVTAEIGAFFKKWGTTITSNPVKATAAVITDFDQRSALHNYPHANTNVWYNVLYQSFDVFHRLGIGVDALNMQMTGDINNLKKYSVIVLASDAVLDKKEVIDALKTYVSQGGKLIVTCFNAYQTWDGLMRNDGFAINLKEIIGCHAQTLRQMSWSSDQKEFSKTIWESSFISSKMPVGGNFFCEMLVPEKGKTIATFEVHDPFVNGKPAAIVNALGKGSALKLGYCPEQEDYVKIVEKFCGISNDMIQLPLPVEIKSVPRSDKSLFVINTSSRKIEIVMKKEVKERISDKKISGKISIEPYEVLWME